MKIRAFRAATGQVRRERKQKEGGMGGKEREGDQGAHITPPVVSYAPEGRSGAGAGVGAGAGWSPPEMPAAELALLRLGRSNFLGASTADGRAFYEHRRTGRVQWEAPTASMATSSEAEEGLSTVPEGSPSTFS